MTFLAICLSNCIDVLIFTFDPDRENRAAVIKFSYISCFVFWEVHIYKASHSVSIRCKSHISIFVVVSVDDLLIKLGIEFLRTQIGSCQV